MSNHENQEKDVNSTNDYVNEAHSEVISDSSKKKRKKKIFRKWWFWLIVGMIVIPIISSNLVENSDDPTSSANCEHSYVIKESKATCTSGGIDTYECSLCKKTYTEYKSALGHTTSEGTCSRCGKSFAKWKISYYVDEFNNYTDEAYITNPDMFVGTFSNSATTNSKLYAKILIDSDDISIKLWEYGSNEVNAFTSTSYDITVLDDSGTKHYLSGTMYKGGERIRLSNIKLIDLLKNNTQLKIYIQENNSYGVDSTYLFSVDCNGFNSVYQSFAPSNSGGNNT